VREKKVAFVGVKVYSVALYVDEAAASVALQGGSGLMDARVEKMLSIKMARKASRLIRRLSTPPSMSQILPLPIISS
jgi:hypothetical protein